MDRLDQILTRLSERINEWEGASREAIEAETNFKSFEASSQKAHMDGLRETVKKSKKARAGKKKA